MCQKRDGGTRGGCQQLHARQQVRGSLPGDQPGDRYTHKGVQGIPEQVKYGNLVREELGGEKQAADD